MGNYKLHFDHHICYLCAQHLARFLAHIPVISVLNYFVDHQYQFIIIHIVYYSYLRNKIFKCRTLEYTNTNDLLG